MPSWGPDLVNKLIHKLIHIPETMTDVTHTTGTRRSMNKM